MNCNETNFEDRYTKIKTTYEMIKEIKNILSEYSEKYRNFSEDIKVEYKSLVECCYSFEKILLIECYTFMEQFIKFFIYKLLKKDTNDNSYVNSFINHKLNEEKFSPNIKIQEIKKMLNEFFNLKIDFIIDDNSEKLKKYDELIRCRHIYAHNGDYLFSFENFKDTISVLQYLKWIFENYLDTKKTEYFLSFFSELKKDLNSIICLSLNLKKNKDNPDAKNKIMLKIEEFSSKIIECKNLYSDKLENIDNVDLLNEFFYLINNIKFENTLLNKFDSLQEYAQDFNL